MATVEKVDTTFIDRTLIGSGLANVEKAFIWSTAVSLSQSLASTFSDKRAEALASGRAIDMEAFKTGLRGRLFNLFPLVFAHTAAFTLIRSRSEGKRGSSPAGFGSMITPLLITAAPGVAWGVYKKAMPPQGVRFGIYSCALLHIYDRVWLPKGLTEENMPTAHLNRRVF